MHIDFSAEDCCKVNGCVQYLVNYRCCQMGLVDCRESICCDRQCEMSAWSCM